MSDRGQCSLPDALLDPIHQNAYRRRVIRRRYRAHNIVGLICASYPKDGLRKPNPLKSALQNPLHRITRLEESELDARGTAFDGQDAWISRFHERFLSHSAIHVQQWAKPFDQALPLTRGMLRGERPCARVQREFDGIRSFNDVPRLSHFCG